MPFDAAALLLLLLANSLALPASPRHNVAPCMAQSSSLYMHGPHQKSHFSGWSTCGAAAIWRATCSSDTWAGFMPPSAPPAMGYSAATVCRAYALSLASSSLQQR